MKKIQSVLTFFLFLGYIFMPVSFANPELDQIVSGNGSVTIDGNVYNFNQLSDKIIAHFGSFNIEAHEITNILQPSSNAAALFRILDQNPSQIFGALNANGHLFLTNPNGIVFGEGAQVNVGSLVASTLDMSNADFLNNNLSFSASEASGLILNQGNIESAAGGYVALLGRAVSNEGSLTAPGGTAILGAGEQVTLSLDGDGLVSVAISERINNAVYDLNGNVINDAISNSGTISADAGRVILSSQAAEEAFDYAINHTGMINATSVVEKNGEIFLTGGEEGITSVSGTLNASGASANETGGTVHVLGDKVGLFAGAHIDASGSHGGGEVLIGGDYQGKNPEIQNARRTYVDLDAVINADAVQKGDGGRVIVWADKSTAFNGNISAQGGQESGNGGFAEVSAPGLNYQGFTDLRADNGIKGTLLLDPKNGQVSDNGADAIATNDAFAENAAADADFSDEAIEGALDGADLVLQVNNDFTIGQAIDASGNAGVGNFEIQAGRSIAVNASVTLRGSFTATANHAGAVDAERDAGDATFTMAAVNTINTSNQNGTVSITYGNGPATNNTVGAMTVGTINSGTGAVTINSTDNNEQENVDLDGQVNSGAISVTGEVVRFDANVTTTNGGGVTVTNGGVIDGTAGVTLNLDGAFTQNQMDALGGNTDNANILFGITTSGDNITFARPINLFQDVLFSTGNGAGDISLQQINNAQNFQLTAGTGSITFNQAVGGGAALTSLLINSAGNVEFDNTVATTGTITQTTGSGTTNFDNTITSGGDLNIANDAITFTTAGNISAAGNTVTLNAETGSITGGTAANDIVAGTINLDAVTGIGTGANPLEVRATTQNIDSSGAGNVVVDSNATGGVTVNTLTAGTGNITYTQTGNQTLEVTTTTTTDGAITIGNTGANLTVTTATAGGDTGSNDDVSLTSTTAGDVIVGNVTATNDVVTINSANDILESGADAGADVTAATANLTAANDIGTGANPLEVTATVLNPTVGGTSNINQVAAALLTGTFGTGVTQNSSAPVTVQNLAVTGTGNNITVTTSSGDISLQNVSAAGGTVTINAQGDIKGSSDEATDVTGVKEVRLIAGNTIGTAGAPVSIRVTGSTIYLSAGGEVLGLSVNVTGNVSRDSVEVLGVPTGLVLYNNHIIGGGSVEIADRDLADRYEVLIPKDMPIKSILETSFENLIDDSALKKG